MKLFWNDQKSSSKAFISNDLKQFVIFEKDTV